MLFVPVMSSPEQWISWPGGSIALDLCDPEDPRYVESFLGAVVQPPPEAFHLCSRSPPPQGNKGALSASASFPRMGHVLGRCRAPEAHPLYGWA